MCKNYRMCKKDYSWNNGTCICENKSNSKSIADDQVIVYDEIACVTYNVSTNVANVISTNVTSTVSIDSYEKKVRYKMDCYILHVLLLAPMLPFLSSLFATIIQNIGQNKTKMAH